MKKTFDLRVPGKQPDRLLDAAKNDIRKYIKRCRSRDLPAGTHFWNFACLLGADEATAQAVHPQQLTEAINTLVAGGATALFASIEPQATARVYKNVAEPWSPDAPTSSASDVEIDADRDAGVGPEAADDSAQH
ncbi:DUF6172 family protein [Burkholderiaceae bacterium]|jgi:hypothetical protein|nr:DUF6172 family protein [Burkholderiaceae bacterium]MDC1458019.1 DUF6172 family protein [Burkholderiaceae bacterium]